MLAPSANLQCIVRYHHVLMANILARAKALMRGKIADQVREESTLQGLTLKEIERLLRCGVSPVNDRPTPSCYTR